MVTPPLNNGEHSNDNIQYEVKEAYSIYSDIWIAIHFQGIS